jgi:uncharacterized protein involved in exopolysaccharide biosynthesis
LFKHKAKIVVTFVTTVVIVAVGTLQAPKTYETKASLMVKAGREYSYQSEVGGQGPPIYYTSEQLVNSEIEILTSPDLIERVVTTLGVQQIYPWLADSQPDDPVAVRAAVMAFHNAFAAKAVKNSNVVELVFRHQNPQMAAQALNLLIDLFKAKHLEVLSTPRSSFLKEQFNYYEAKLHEAEEKLKTYQQKHRVFSLKEQRTLLLEQRRELDTSFKAAQNEIEQLQQKVKSFENQMATVARNVPVTKGPAQHQVVDEARADLLALQLKEQELVGGYKKKNLISDDNYLLVKVRKEIELVKNFLTEQERRVNRIVRTEKNAVYQQLESDLIQGRAELSALHGRSKSLAQQLKEVDHEIGTIATTEKELDHLQRDVAVNEKNYQTYAAKLEEARILEDMDRQKMANIGVINAAFVPTASVGDLRLTKLLLAVLLGAALGLGVALFSENLSQGLSTPQRAERIMKLPVIATIPHKET